MCVRDSVVMSIESAPRPARNRRARPAAGAPDASIDSSRPPEDLLPDGGNPPTPAPAPDTLPARGEFDADPGHSRDAEVDLVLEQLTPIRSRAALVSSYEREAFHRVGCAVGGRRSRATRLAYVRRWLALGADPGADPGAAGS